MLQINKIELQLEILAGIVITEIRHLLNECTDKIDELEILASEIKGLK